MAKTGLYEEKMDLKEIKGIMVRRHPWETSRLYFFLNLLKICKIAKPQSMLDVGAGDAFFAQELRKEFTPSASLCCVDLNYPEEKNEGNVRFIKKLPTECFDLIMLMDVLEHVPDEALFLKELLDKNSHQETVFLISVPAWQCLFSAHDKKLEHFRRYNPKLLSEVLKQNGLEIIKQGAFFHGLLAPRLMAKLLEGFNKNQNHTADLGQWKKGALVTLAVESLLKVDCSFSLLLARFGIQLPGLSLWAIGRVKKIKAN